MKTISIRIALWGGLGFLVAACWGFYFANASKNLPIDQRMLALAKLTQPAAAVALYINPAASLSLAWALAANVAAYAILGLIAVLIQRRWALHIAN